ncbi:glycosyltransferase family 76 protein [Viridothelium virens]|uniref:GPI mannosyltransferase 2 n=1 Tax=Viridothelium virens TaxID=1048519 RepID=A0A6A6H0F7_VIRVR|nr:glycosyltransferase family 76 protein [Viridothelium virens]
MTDFTPARRPIASLTICFVLWKALLMAVARISPGFGYDTSSTLLLARDALGPDVGGSFSPLLMRLTRWDGIFYAKISERGYVYEQEWAFGWGFTRLLSLIAKACSSSCTTVEAHVWAGIVISHLSHFASVLVLHSLVQKLHPLSVDKKTAFVAAVLHIVSPAGLFLSAPFSESLFSFLSFAGTWLFLHSTCNAQDQRKFSQDLFILVAGTLFGLATTVRSNGLFNGLMVAFEFIHESCELVQDITSFPIWRRFISLGAAGILLAAGFVGPQAIAFFEICRSSPHSSYPRTWCNGSFTPSIYTWVQKHYWGTGFLKYWKISNIPLFILSSPMLYFLIVSALEILTSVARPADYRHTRSNTHNEDIVMSQKSDSRSVSSNTKAPRKNILLRLALPQLLVSVLALTYFHVQIINRLSSGYPLWYLWVASQLVEDHSVFVPTQRRTNPSAKRPSGSQSQIIVRGMVMYAIIHAGLFSCFLPPA